MTNKVVNIMFLDYLDQYRNKSFEEVACNDLDLLAFSLLSYLSISSNNFFEDRNFNDVLDDMNTRKEEVYASLFPYREKDIDHFLTLLHGTRYSCVHIIAFIEENDLDNEEQFSATVFKIPNKTCIIAYRGTDASFIGWKEDCKLSLSKPISSQIEACAFLEEIAAHTNEPLQICGHSKGGNLAIFAASFASDDTQFRISDVVNFDGPGISSFISDSDSYKKIANNIRVYIPKASIVGLLFQQPPDVRIIDSTGAPIAQHSPFLWMTKDDSLCFSPQITASAHIVSEGIQGLIKNLTETQKENFIEVLYRIAISTDASSFTELFDKWNLKTLKSLCKVVIHMDRESSKLIFYILKLYWQSLTAAIVKAPRYSETAVAAMGPQPQLILASASPRRKQLLHDAGFKPIVMPSNVDENAKSSLLPYRLAKYLASQKAYACLNMIKENYDAYDPTIQIRQDNFVIIAADTIVALEKEVFGKPKDANDAKRMLKQLSGNTHRVITGVCIINSKGVKSCFADITRVTFHELNDKDIETYIASGEPFDKAGAYGIQGLASVFVEKILGSYSNVVGLPTEKCRKVLAGYGISPNVTIIDNTERQNQL